MSVRYSKKIAHFEGVVSVEEAESLRLWLELNPKGKINFAKCEHLHTAVLQVILAMRPAISALPADAARREFFIRSLNPL